MPLDTALVHGSRSLLTLDTQHSDIRAAQWCAVSKCCANVLHGSRGRQDAAHVVAFQLSSFEGACQAEDLEGKVRNTTPEVLVHPRSHIITTECERGWTVASGLFECSIRYS